MVVEEEEEEEEKEKVVVGRKSLAFRVWLLGKPPDVPTSPMLVPLNSISSREEPDCRTAAVRCSMSSGPSGLQTPKGRQRAAKEEQPNIRGTRGTHNSKAAEVMHRRSAGDSPFAPQEKGMNVQE